MGFLDIFKRKKKQEVADIVESESDKIETGLNIVPSVDDEMVVLMEQLPSTYSLGDKSLIEISDSHVLAKIDGLVPYLNTAGVSVGNIIKTVREAQGDKLYTVLHLWNKWNTLYDKTGFPKKICVAKIFWGKEQLLKSPRRRKAVRIKERVATQWATLCS